MNDPLIHPFGLRPTPRDRRDFSRHRMYGSPALPELPTEFSNEDNETFPNPYLDQGATDFCSAYSIAESECDAQGIVFSPDYQFAKTKQIEGTYATFGADLRTAMKSAIQYGCLPQDKATITWQKDGRDVAANWAQWPAELDAIAAQYKEKAFITADGPYDAFDNIRVSIWQHFTRFGKRRDVILGTQWLWGANLNNLGADGVAVPTPAQTNVWHAYEVKGWKIKNGVPMLQTRPHSLSLGDRGYVYFSREVVNASLSVPYAVAFMFDDSDPALIKNVQLQNQATTNILIELYHRLIEALTALIVLKRA